MVKNQKIPRGYIHNENDIIGDILQRVIALFPSLSPEMAAQIDKEVRQQWGGDRPYIGIRSGAGHSSRNAAIKRDYQAGERIPLLERRYGLAKTRLWEIINTPEAVHPFALKTGHPQGHSPRT